MREIRPSSLEGGVRLSLIPTPIGGSRKLRPPETIPPDLAVTVETLLVS